MFSKKNKPQIVVVEEDNIVARDINQQLTALGYEPIGHVVRASQAIGMTRRMRPDLVLMTISLANAADGIAVAQSIHLQFEIPVIFIANFDADVMLERAQLAEPFGYIQKPFSERDLRTILKMALYKYQIESQLCEAALYHQTILNNMMDGVIVIDENGVVESINSAGCSIFGYLPEDILGHNVTMLMPLAHRGHHNSYLGHYHHTGEARILGTTRELQGQRHDGKIFPLSLSVSKILLSKRTVFVGLIRDVTEHCDDIEKIHHLAFYDALTGLPNRRLLTDRLQQAMASSARSGGHGALMFLDLDHFKQLNDALGHTAGDELLLQVASRLKLCIREGDSVARLGGDEFVILLEDLSRFSNEAANQAEAVAKNILNTLGLEYTLHGHKYKSTPSIGIVVFMEDHESIDILLKKADVAMYQAKAAGRNTARFFDRGLQALANHQTDLKNALQYGLVNEEFILHYQRQVDRTGTIIGVEALVRWNQPRRGMVHPAEFISLAEQTGLILPLGQWVLETACAQLAQWSKHAETALWTMAVNVSSVQFAQADFVEKVALALQKTGANPYLLKLELTESMLVSDLEGIIIKMKDIKSRGISFSLDDFGTGYSSLSYLKRLPLDQLKIDQSFVRDVLSDQGDEIIVRTILALGHSLGLTVIAEGVETEQQRDFLTSSGCDSFQGYFFGRPELASGLYCTKSDQCQMTESVVL
jgi:diguanylate cyclase (GGDEF)-like protein/PAS domain S-box-containing protein